DLETASGGASAIAILAFENRRRIGRDELVTFQHELGVKAVARRFVNGLPAEGAVKFVFVIVVAAEAQFLTVGCELLFFVQDDELRCAPRLARLADVTPEFVDRAFEISVADKIIAGRFRRDLLSGIDSCLLDSRRRRLAAGQEKQAQKNFDGEKELERAISHGHLPLSQGTGARNIASVAVALGAMRVCGHAAFTVAAATGYRRFCIARR